MKADIITIGDEILIGQIQDTNTTWMGHFLESNGIHVRETSTVSDSKTSIYHKLYLHENISVKSNDDSKNISQTSDQNYN